MSDRRRNLFILLVVLGLMAASSYVVASKPTRLGLDLQGGVELVYQGKPTPQVPTINAEAIDRALDILRKRVDALGVAEPEISRSGDDQLVVSLPGVPNAEDAERRVGDTAQMFFYDWEPNVLDEDCKPDPENLELTQSPIGGKKEAVERASKCVGLADNNDTAKGSTFYVFDKGGKEVGTGDSREDALEDLEGKAVPGGGAIYEVPQGVKVVRAELPDNTSEEAARRFDQWYVIRDNPELSGTDIENPEQNFDQRTQEPIVTMEFTDKGRDAFQEVTRRIAQRGSETLPTLPEQQRFQHFAIVLDDELVSRPFIDFVENPDGIDGGSGAQISGGFTISSAQDLAEFLKIGALPVKLELISRSTVSASLGRQALNQGLTAGLAGFIIVALFLLVFYRVLGVIAVVALGVYALYFYALVKLVPITLTLPGIAGLILTIGVAADANIVVFERIKEEIRAGRSVAAGIAQGYKKGFGSILDANIVTLLVAFILFVLATAGVKGFAFALGIGVIVSLFTAVLATQAILLSLRNSKLLEKPSALGAGKPKRPITFDFMGTSRWFFSLSGMILLVCALAIAGKGIDFGIDFESGTRIKTPLEQRASAEDVRNLLESRGFDSAKVQTLNDPELGANVVQISIKKLPPPEVTNVRQALDQRWGVDGENFSSDSIGPTFGETIATSAVRAIIASLLIIAIYLTLRFQWKFAVPVLIALMHDLMITAGVYALVDREVTTSTVAALLTIMGFSLYDTIIVFDRIRENEPRMPSATFAQVVNRSMSEVIVRSIATSFCALLPVLALFFFGGDTLKDFAFALIVGTISGTYSSVFIAGPVLTHWKQREPVYRAREARIREAFGGLVPAYLTSAPAGLGPIDIGPQEEQRKRTRITSPTDPAQGVSKEEFDQMVAELDVEAPRPATAPAGAPGTGATPRGGRRAARRAAADRGEQPPSSPSAPSSGDGERPAKQPGGGSKSRKTRRHGRPR